MSAFGKIVLNTDLKTGAARAYSKALVASVKAMTKSEPPHYLDRAASIPGNGSYTEDMAVCFVCCFYRGILLQLTGKVARVKTDVRLVYHILHLETGGR